MVTLTTSQCLDIALSSVVTIKGIALQLSHQEEIAQTTQKQGDANSSQARQNKFLSDLKSQLDTTQKWLNGFADRRSQSLPRSTILYLLDTLEQLCILQDRHQILKEDHDEGYIYDYTRLKRITVADDTLLERLAQEAGPNAQIRREDLLRRLASLPWSDLDKVIDRSAYETPTGGVTIASLAADCLNSFENRSKVVSEIDEEKIQVQLARFNIWASNIGVFVRGGLSLDKRLEAAPDIAELFNELLEMLQSFIEQASLSPQPKETGIPNEAATPALMHRIPKALDDEKNIQTTPKYLHEIAGLITRLHRLSIAVRAAGERNLYSRISNFTIVDEQGEDIDSTFESFVQQILQSHYPNLPTPLKERLASAICFRRRRFLYHVARSQKLAQRTYDAPHLENRRPNDTELNIYLTSPSSTTGSKNPHEPISLGQSLVSPSTVPSGFDRSKLRLPATGSQTQESIAPSENAVVQRSTEIPLPPKVPKDLPEYPCPYCRKVCASRTFLGTRWKAHFEKDLEPYNCLFHDCSEPNALFATSKDWLSHTITHYSQEWTCRICRNEVFSRKQDLRQHLKRTHTQLATYQIQTLLQHGTRRREPLGTLFPECLFCKHSSSVDGMSDEQAAKENSDMNDHIANHLLSISMISLPLAWRKESSTMSAPGSVQLSEASNSVTGSSVRTSASQELEQRLPLPENEVESKQRVGAWMDAQELAEPTDMSPDLAMSASAIDPESIVKVITIKDNLSSGLVTSLPARQDEDSLRFASLSSLQRSSPRVSVGTPEVESYRYRSISSLAIEEFRLLHIMPAQHTTDPIYASISHQSINDHPDYIALCYCWDYSKGEEPIIMVDGLAMHVRHNLFSALCVLREQDSEVILWVDALCINMHDMAERQGQISVMRNFFIQAASVWIWLGGEESTSAALREIQVVAEKLPTTLSGKEEPSGESSAAVGGRPFIRKILKRVRRSSLEFKPPAIRSSPDRVPDPSDHGKQVIKEQGEVAISRPTDFAPVLRNGVFNRRWIIQEVVVAQSVMVFGQGCALAWSDFERVVENFTHSNSQVTVTEAWQFIQVTRALQGRADSRLVEQPASFETIVTLATNFSNTDPRDTIYALLSLIRSDEPPWPGTIDYTISFDKIALEYVQYAISSSKSLNVICRPWIQDWSRGESPSWICTMKSLREAGGQGIASLRQISDTFVGMPGKCKYEATKRMKPIFGPTFKGSDKTR
ncbi:uncharacterized protein BP5553_05673 [Venustampulla echinocandica]|uniref:C2H2-type domain-containing protein n=1 Tax=Venustampulla echinocandica TaxID=2656787 RepID=A0A370TLC3_9HELO|nr:uncharacterized protein BP5553_05673 [Venustampulla echinocandica]RDL36321.1 hypothetical protein BP5553_05673 [Venustampulla echinocandica]